MTQENPPATIQDVARVMNNITKSMILPPNALRKFMGLPLQKNIRQIYYIEGVTDLHAQLKDVTKSGEAYFLHYHKSDEPCNRQCVVHRKEDDESTEDPGLDTDRG